jgi:hypothetical protein
VEERVEESSVAGDGKLFYTFVYYTHYTVIVYIVINALRKKVLSDFCPGLQYTPQPYPFLLHLCLCYTVFVYLRKLSSLLFTRSAVS